MTGSKNLNSIKSDRPISDDKDDCFDVGAKIVNKIVDIVDNKITGQTTIAVTGSWGVGKTSVR